MNLWRLVWRELTWRRGRVALSVLAVAVAVGGLLGAAALLGAHERRTQTLLAEKEAALQARLATLDDDMRKAMLGLGFNVVILPKDQNLADFHADDFASKDMPEEYVSRLAHARMVTVQHILPLLQRKVEWPEAKRRVMLIGTRGELPATGPEAKKPMVQPVPAGTVALGYELHQALGVKEGAAVEFAGRQFTVHRCLPARGTRDDVTVWMPLDEAQALLGQPGRINAIVALECKCAWADLGKVRAEITKILPETQVIERSGEALARAEARLKVEAEGHAAIAAERAGRDRLRAERERLAALLVPLLLLGGGVWVGLLAAADVRDRRIELALLRALGVGRRQVLAAFLGKALVLGVAGGVAGLALGGLAGAAVAPAGTAAAAGPLFDVPTVALALVLAPALSLLACWLPARAAANQDPAAILREA